MLLLPRKNSLTSLFKEVRVLKEVNKVAMTPSPVPSTHIPVGGQTRSYLAKTRFPFFYRVFAPKTENMVFSVLENWHFSVFLDVPK